MDTLNRVSREELSCLNKELIFALHASNYQQLDTISVWCSVTLTVDLDFYFFFNVAVVQSRQ